MLLKQLYFVAVAILISANAQAYVDPGSSLLLLQGVLALAGAMLVFVRHPITTTKAIFARIKKSAQKKAD